MLSVKVRRKQSFVLIVLNSSDNIILSAILAIVKRKTNICNRHQFAVASYSASDVAIQCDFTSRISDIEGALSSINIDLITGAEESIDLARVVERAGEKLLHYISDTDYLTRCVVIFGRSKEVIIIFIAPKFNVSLYYARSRCTAVNLQFLNLSDFLSTFYICISRVLK